MKFAILPLVTAAFAATPAFSWSFTIYDGDTCDGNTVELSGEGDTDTGCQPYPNGPDGFPTNSFIAKGWGENCRLSLSTQSDCRVDERWASDIGYTVQMGYIYSQDQCNSLFTNYFITQTYKYYQYYCV